jgi:O-antigen/teichoic acid export membrane protein
VDSESYYCAYQHNKRRTLLLYLGEERYAVYVIVYSLIGWFSLCDLGIGSAVQNFISECRAKK